MTGATSYSDEATAFDTEDDVRLTGPVIVGLITLVLGVGAFFAWASTTPLSAASVASGIVVVESRNKTVTHLEGGVLKAMLVVEGQSVKAGEPLVLLDTSRSQASLTQLRLSRYSTRIRLARFLAERDDRADLEGDLSPEEGMTAAQTAIILSTERKLLAERRKLLQDQADAEAAQIAQAQSQASGIKARKARIDQQVAHVRRTTDALLALRAREYVTQSVVNDKMVWLLDLETRQSDAAAQLNENQSRQTEILKYQSNRKTEFLRSTNEQIQFALAEVARITQDINATEDLVRRATITAPQDGIVANLRMRTPGSAVPGSQPILDIVPADQTMLVEAQVAAADIASVAVGQTVEIVLSAFHETGEPPLKGKVQFVAPDGVVNPQNGQTTFTLRSDIDPQSLKDHPHLFLHPGMVGEVYVVSKERTALNYLLEPVHKSFRHAFRQR